MYNIGDIERILHNISYSILGNRVNSFDNAKSIKESNNNSITFCKKYLTDGQELIEKTSASVIICGDDLTINEHLLANKLFVIVEDPRLIFTRIISALFKKKPDYKIHPTAFIEDSAKIHSEVYIGPFTYIGDRVTIGRGSIIYGNIYIYPNVQVGENVIINSGVVIGADGFGYHRNNDGVWEKFPHIGNVIIEDDVEIGANSCIDRGTLGPTWIKKGVKLDNLVYVGHNAVIGEHTGIAGNTTIGGSIIGKYCWIAPGCTIKEKITIGDNSFIGMASAVVADVKEGSFVLGVPARKIKENSPIYPPKEKNRRSHDDSV